MKKLLLSTAFILAASVALANDDNSAAISGSNNTANQITGNNNALVTGSGAFSSSANATATGGAGGNATATGGAGGSATARSGDSNSAVIGSGNSVNSNSTGNQTATTGNQSVNVKNPKQAPTVVTPGLANGYNCNGSASFGGSVAGFGFGGGTTTASAVCENVFLYRVLKDEVGDKDGALGVLCEIPEVRKHSTHCKPVNVDDLIGLNVEDVPAPTNGSRNR